jgi:hypothetical protein
MVERNNFPVRRTTRQHGFNKQTAGAIAQFEYEKKVRPVRPSGDTVYIQPACRFCKRLHPYSAPCRQRDLQTSAQ